MTSFWESGSSVKISPDRQQVLELPPDFPLVVKFYIFTSLNRLIPNNHDFYEIAHIYSGKGTFHVADRSYPARRGDTFVINDSSFHLLESLPGAGLKVMVVHFRPGYESRPGISGVDIEYLLPFMSRTVSCNNRIPADPKRYREIERLFKRMKQESVEQKSYYRQAMKNCLCEMLLLINRFYRNTVLKGGKTAESDSKMAEGIVRLANVFTHIHNNYAEKISVDDLAKAAFVTPNYLCRLFKKVTGTTIIGYITRYRIDKAKELLVTSKAPITHIAIDTGFESHSYFDRIFHQLTRVSPQQFRQKFS